MLLKSLVYGALSLSNTAFAQQFAGEAYDNTQPDVSLSRKLESDPGLRLHDVLTYPQVPGSEKAFWNIIDKKARSFSQLNYFSNNGKGQRLNTSDVKRAVIVIHGLNRDPGTYMSNMLSALSQVPDGTGPDFSNTQIIAPMFPNGNDKNTGYPWNATAPAGGYGSTSRALVWQGSGWMNGDNNQYPRLQIATSSFDCVDQYITYFANKTMYPNMKQIVVSGHSAGAQFVQRYAMVGKDLSTVLGDIGLTYWVGNPDSYGWLNSSRPFDTSDCATYNDWRDGLDSYEPSYNTALVGKGVAAVQAIYQSRSIAYARALQDRGDTSSTCGPDTTGANRDERFFNFISYFPPTCSSGADTACDTVDYVDTGHDAGVMFASAAGRTRLFVDNFNGDGTKASDVYCPRQQTGDSPHPDPSCNEVANLAPTDVYNGMSYQGCWTDQDPRSFTTQLSDDEQLTVESCTAACISQGYKLAGMEYGVQCYCGNTLTSKAEQTINRSCNTACGGNSTQQCGGSNRLSVWGTTKPTDDAKPTAPTTIGDYEYAGCYFDNNPSKALTTTQPGGSFMTLEICATSCSGYQYFGTEYGGECYCGNVMTEGNTKTDESDCSMLCSGNTTEYCGNGNRLTLYSLNGAEVVFTGGSSSSSSSSTSTRSTSSATQSSSTTITSESGTTTSSQAPTSTSLSCPGDDGATYTSAGKVFQVQCGKDHAGGDLNTLSTDTFSGCVDACAATSGCVVLALRGNTCYLKSSVGEVVQDSGILGAILVSAVSSSTSSTASSTSLSSTTSPSTSTKSSATSSTSTTSTSSTPTTSTPEPTAITCPASNGTIYTAVGSTAKFQIECGFEHGGGDMPSPNPVYVSSLAACLDACAARTGCLTAAFTGSACYLKQTVGSVVNDGANGGLLVTA
ncbi:WSC domain-containing protein [Xylariaceae sp. FL1019]|nr:WSC domain-containing protein [Xylariaceae sp. FL1019]